MADAVISRVAMTASYVALGYLLQRVGAVKRDDGVVMLKFVVQVTLPALLLHTLTHSGPLFGPGTPLVFMIAVLASAIVAGGSYLLHRRKPSYERGLLVGCATGVNLGTFAYPFLEAVWGPEGLRLAALYDIPNALIVFGVASAIFATEERNTRMEAKERSGKHQDGGVYEGEWTGMDASGNQYKQGVGVYTYPSGASYEGQWNNNVKEGYGVYKWAKGGSYAGEWKRGTFNGMGLRFLRSGKFKSGRFEEGEFVESMDMAKSDEAASKAADCSREARKAAEKSRGVQETNAQAAARIIAKTFDFSTHGGVDTSRGGHVGRRGCDRPGGLRASRGHRRDHRAPRGCEQAPGAGHPRRPLPAASAPATDASRRQLSRRQVLPLARCGGGGDSLRSPRPRRDSVHLRRDRAHARAVRVRPIRRGARRGRGLGGVPGELLAGCEPRLSLRASARSPPRTILPPLTGG
jgi:hypothetical protein